jgi:outer membrane protein OmpA-like peptidoglycan-associated protein
LIVALADESRSPSRIIVSNTAGSVELTGEGESTRVYGTAAPTAAAVIDPAALQKIFGDTINDLPRAAERFNLYFQVESDELTEESRALLPDIVRSVSGREVPEVTVIGHTDTTGEAAANYELGLKRAAAVRALLVASGVNDALVEVSSHGEGDLLVATPDNTSEPRNRRVEITVK